MLSDKPPKQTDEEAAAAGGGEGSGDLGRDEDWMLDETELKNLKYVSMDQLRQVGSMEGAQVFCRLLVTSGKVERCSPNNKLIYATYLKAIGKLYLVFKAHADKFSALAKYTLEDKLADYRATGQLYQKCVYGTSNKLELLIEENHIPPAIVRAARDRKDLCRIVSGFLLSMSAPDDTAQVAAKALQKSFWTGGGEVPNFAVKDGSTYKDFLKAKQKRDYDAEFGKYGANRKKHADNLFEALVKSKQGGVEPDEEFNAGSKELGELFQDLQKAEYDRSMYSRPDQRGREYTINDMLGGGGFDGGDLHQPDDFQFVMRRPNPYKPKKKASGGRRKKSRSRSKSKKRSTPRRVNGRFAKKE